MTGMGWAFIGSGRIANIVANQIVNGRQHTIVSVFSRNISTAQVFADKYGGIVCDTFEEAVFNENVNAVYIATPNDSHYKYVIKALEFKKPVLCEKPLGMTLEQVRTMTSVAKKNATYLAEGMWTWFNPTANTVQEWINGGKIGKIKSVKGSLCMNAMRYKGSNSRYFDPKQGGSLYDLGVYGIAFMVKLFGKPNVLKCTGKEEDGVEIRESIHLQYDGFRCRLKSGFDSNSTGLYIFGNKGVVILPSFWNASKAYCISSSGVYKISKNASYLYEFNTVSHEIAMGKRQSDYMDHTTSLCVAELLDECRRQLKYD